LGSNPKFDEIMTPLADKLGAAPGANRAAVDARSYALTTAVRKQDRRTPALHRRVSAVAIQRGWHERFQ
jgi:hypothetical protein